MVQSDYCQQAAENLKIEGFWKAEDHAEPRDEINPPDKTVMLGGPLAEDRGFILHNSPSTCFILFQITAVA